MPPTFQVAGESEMGLPSWRDPRFNESAAFGMTPDAIWNQALAQYEAGLKGGGYSPEELDRLFLAPARLATGRPQPESPWSGPIETAGGGIYQVNKQNGAMRVIRAAGEPKKTTIHSPDLGLVQVDNAGNVQTLVPPKSKDQNIETVTETYPEQPAVDPTPGTPGSSGIPILHWFATEPKPEIPGTPATPKTVIEYKRPHVSSIRPAGTNAPAPPSVPAISTPAIQPAGGIGQFGYSMAPQTTRMRDKSGNLVAVPSSRVGEMIDKGYTVAQ